MIPLKPQRAPIRCATLAIVLLGGGTSAYAAEPDFLWAKEGASASAMLDDYVKCAKAAIAVQGGDASTPSWKPLVPPCMRANGYRPMRLTDEEAEQTAANKSPATAQAWIDAFYARPDFLARLKATP